MNTELLTQLLEEQKDEIKEAVKAKAIERLTSQVSWNLPDLIKADVNEFYATEISPLVKQYLADNKAALMQNIIKACVDASDAVAASMAEHIKKTMGDEYKAKKVFSALFNTAY